LKHIIATTICLIGISPACAAGNADQVGETGCQSAKAIAGAYQCSGECLVRSENGINLVEVTGELDRIEKIKGASTGLYRNEITGENGFKEVEIGALAGFTLRSATANVSDGHYPVLEEYVFEVDGTCDATAFTKIVRNPDPENFKACNIRCLKK